MGKSTPQAPTPPDPYATANAQTQNNIGTAQANSILQNADVYTPQGSSTFNQIGTQSIQVPDGRGGFTSMDVPRWQNTQSLTPEGQRQYQQQQQLGGALNNLAINQTNRVGDVLGSPISSNGLPNRVSNLGSLPNLQGVNLDRAAMSGPAIQMNAGQQGTFADVGGPRRTVGPTDYSADRTRVEDAIYSRLNPQLDRERAGLENNLVNQGFQRGTQAFTDAMDQYGRQANDARMQAVLAGGQEQSRLAGLDFNRFGLENAAQAQDFNQAQQRGNFYNNAALTNAQFANQGQQQQFGQQMDIGNFNNNAALTEANLNNQNAAQLYGLNAQNAGFQNSARDAGLQEQLALRNQPINEISALMSGGQVSLPQFAQYQGGNVGNTDLSGSVYNTAALGQQNYQTQLANQTAKQNALIGGLAGLGGAGLYGLARRT